MTHAALLSTALVADLWRGASLDDGMPRSLLARAIGAPMRVGAAASVGKALR